MSETNTCPCGQTGPHYCAYHEPPTGTGVEIKYVPVGNEQLPNLTPSAAPTVTIPLDVYRELLERFKRAHERGHKSQHREERCEWEDCTIMSCRAAVELLSKLPKGEQ